MKYTLLVLKYSRNTTVQKKKFYAPYSFGLELFETYQKDDLIRPSIIWSILYDLRDLISKEYTGHQKMIDELTSYINQMVIQSPSLVKVYEKNLEKNPTLTSAEIVNLIDEEDQFFDFLAYGNEGGL
jgi:hypothetical protein